MQMLRSGLRHHRGVARVSAVLALVLGVGLLTAAPADAAAIDHGLPHTAGHTCIPDPSNTLVMCVEIGIYTSSATGAQSVTTEVQAICQTSGGIPQQCNSATVSAEVANAGGPRPSATYSCGPCLFNKRNFFYPFNGFPISAGHCDNNVWGVLLAGSQLSGPGGSAFLGNNLGTPHFDVCEDSAGNPTFTRR